ncbi:sugar transporter [Acinetobacter sp. S40]|uniref:sugar transporter n=1 Tax=Acinetobacter sp. S40 TaxID=2767434 RepID=UPI00190B5CD4|nr:sugar transporter [Acinetobacter sp. S40]MBJ9985857.1 sugar transporter [Acinetobacter sp. S40]
MPIYKNEKNKSWIPVITLAIAAFIFNTTEFLPVGLLTDIATSFNIEVAYTGQILTVYAWAVTLFALPFAMLFSRFERRNLLIYVFLIFIISHVFTAFSWSFNSLLFSRLGVAASHAVFWAITIPIAVRLAPAGQSAKALSLVVTGSSLAMVLGVPIGTIIGQHFGWRFSFGLIALLATLTLLLLVSILPRLPSYLSGSLSTLPSLLMRPTLIYVYITLALVISAYFTTYTFISPFLQQVGKISSFWIVINLFIIGISGIVGGVLFAKKSKNHPIALFILPMLMLLLCALALHLASFYIFSTLVISLLWGISITLLGMILQNKVLEIASDAPDIAMAMFSAVYNIGIGSGALLGGQIILNFGLLYLGYLSSIFILFALFLYFFIGRKLWNTPLY